MADFGNDEYPNMLCVESGQVSHPIILRPGTTFEASQVLQVSRSLKRSCCQDALGRRKQFLALPSEWKSRSGIMRKE